LKNQKQIPPKLATKLLHTFLRTDLAEEVEGDLEEKFYSDVKSKSIIRSKFNYWFEVLNYLRPFAIRKSKSYSNHYPMYKSYFKIGWRNLLKNKTYSLINIGGLAIGLACCTAIALYIWDEFSYDRFHTNYSTIYRVVEKQAQAGNIYNVAVTPGPLVPVLKSDFSEVDQTCRIGRIWTSSLLKTETLAAEPRNILVVDNSFFSLFDFKLLKGNSEKVLLNTDEIVISEALAEKLFGTNWETDHVLGRPIEYNKEYILTLSGVVANPPTNSHIQFDALLSQKIEALSEFNYNWENNNCHTYISLHPLADQKSFEAKITKLLFNYSSDTTTTLALQPLSKIYLHSNFDFQSDWIKAGNIIYIKIFAVVGSLVLLIALFNFINLSTARAMNRAKEVGVRKVIGAFQKQLIVQFLIEGFILTLLAMGISLIFLQLFLPLLNIISGKTLVIPFLSTTFIISIIILSFIISFTAGIYPAFFLASFKPAKVLKGFFTTGSSPFFRKSLIVSQFTFSIVLIIGTIVIYKQIIFLQNKNLGFDKAQLIHVTLKNESLSKSLLLKNDLKNQSSITDATIASRNLVNVNSSTDNILWEGKEEGNNMRLFQLNIDPDFISTTGMTLMAGRNFDSNIGTDTTSAYIINETAAREMGWTPDQAIGKVLRFWDIDGSVIGVVKDFHFRPMTVSVEPMLLRYWPWENNSVLLVKVKANQVSEALTSIETLYKKYDSESEFQYRFIDQVIENQYRAEQNTARIVLYFSILTIIVSCLGLFGLAAYTAEKRTKEIGVRKVMGASVSSIVNLLSKDFIKLVLIAILFASPFAWWIVNQWLNSFAYKVEVEWWVFLVSGLTAITIALLTVSSQSINAAKMNPVNSLKSE
jgi:putative ABC transport system permease protein